MLILNANILDVLKIKRDKYFIAKYDCKEDIYVHLPMRFL